MALRRPMEPTGLLNTARMDTDPFPTLNESCPCPRWRQLAAGVLLTLEEDRVYTEGWK